MLYSRAPTTRRAMAAHFGKFVGDALLLFSLTRLAPPSPRGGAGRE